MNQAHGGPEDGAPHQPQQEQSGGFAERIRPHMEVVSAEGEHIGTVDSIEGDEIKLARGDSPDGRHSYVPLSLVDAVEESRVIIRSRGDNAFGVAV